MTFSLEELETIKAALEAGFDYEAYGLLHNDVTDVYQKVEEEIIMMKIEQGVHE